MNIIIKEIAKNLIEKGFNSEDVFSGKVDNLENRIIEYLDEKGFFDLLNNEMELIERGE